MKKCYLGYFKLEMFYNLNLLNTSPHLLPRPACYIVDLYDAICSLTSLRYLLGLQRTPGFISMGKLNRVTSKSCCLHCISFRGIIVKGTENICMSHLLPPPKWLCFFQGLLSVCLLGM